MAFISTTSVSVVACDNAAVTTGTWYHVAGVWNSTSATLSIYINGLLVSSAVTAVTPDSSSGYPLTIGNILGTYFLNGTIDDVRIYNRPLSAADVMTLYTSTGGTSGDIQSGLIHYWKLDESPVATVAGDTVGGANITLAGTAAFAAGGKINNDLYLPNDSTVKGSGVTTPADMLGKSALTMALWLKRACAGCVVETGQELGSNGEEIAIQAWTDGNIYVDIGGTGSGTEAYAGVASDDTSWHHVALVF